MGLLIPVHIVAGVPALVFGHVALSAAKGGALLPIPVLTLVVVMLYWLWRIHGRKKWPGIAAVSASHAAAIAAPQSASYRAFP